MTNAIRWPVDYAAGQVTAACQSCGQRYVHWQSVICGLCRAQGRTGPPKPVEPVWRRVRVTARHSSRCGLQGIGRETSTGWTVHLEGGGKCLFRKNAVEVLG